MEMTKIPTINLLDDGIEVAVRSHNVEIIITSSNGNIILKHRNRTPMTYFLNDDIDENLKHDKHSKEIVITR